MPNQPENFQEVSQDPAVIAAARQQGITQESMTEGGWLAFMACVATEMLEGKSSEEAIENCKQVSDH